MRALNVMVVLVAVSMASSAGVAAQERGRWYLDVDGGWSWPVTSGAFSAGPATGLAVGYAVTPSLALRMGWGRADHPYSDARFGELFVVSAPSTADAGELSAHDLALTAGVEWSPVEWGAWQPVVATGFAVERHTVGGFVGSPAWARCSPGTRFLWSTDPVTGRTTLTTSNPVPEAGCDDLRRDIADEGWTVGLTSSAGMLFRFGGYAVGGLVRYAHAVTSPVRGRLSARLAWRFYL